jgi:hypothetical protein
MIEDAPEDQARENERGRTAHLGNVDYAQLAITQRRDEHVHHLARRVVQHPDDGRHVRARGDHLGVLAGLKAQELPDRVAVCRVPVAMYEIDELVPIRVVHALELPHVLLVLLLG